MDIPVYGMPWSSNRAVVVYSFKCMQTDPLSDKELIFFFLYKRECWGMRLNDSLPVQVRRHAGHLSDPFLEIGEGYKFRLPLLGMSKDSKYTSSHEHCILMAILNS